MYKLRPDKYSNLTTAQLKLLSNKVLYRFQLQCEKQAKQWSDRIAEINIVAKSKGWDVTRSIK
jgi:transposase